jgi:hypothetical protein
VEQQQPPQWSAPLAYPPSSYPTDPQAYIPWTPLAGYQEPANWTGNQAVPRTAAAPQNINDVNLRQKGKSKKRAAVAGGASGFGIIGILVFRFVVMMGSGVAQQAQPPRTFLPPVTTQVGAVDWKLANPLQLQTGQCFQSSVLFDGFPAESVAQFVKPCARGLSQVVSSGLVREADQAADKAKCPGQYWSVTLDGTTDQYT